VEAGIGNSVKFANEWPGLPDRMPLENTARLVCKLGIYPAVTLGERNNVYSE
jgi:hypothetical protein